MVIKCLEKMTLYLFISNITRLFYYCRSKILSKSVFKRMQICRKKEKDEYN